MRKEPRSAYDKWNISVVTNKVMDWYKQTTIFCLASFKVSVFDLSCVEAFFFLPLVRLSFGVRYCCLSMSILRSCWILNSMLIFYDLQGFPILKILPYLWHSVVFGLCSCCVQILLLFSVPVLWIWSFLVRWIPNCACIFHCRSYYCCICCWLYRFCAVFKVSADKS
jgi:hypothetical protein